MISHFLYHFAGGWASGSCPHMVVYCLKFVLRGESPRDYADLLRSLKHPPSISISDIPDRLASHVNNNVPRFFTPNNGRLFPVTKDNIAAAEQGILHKRLPWIHNEGAPSVPFPENDCQIEESLHPITRVADRYSLSDRFHERNSSQKRALLSRVTLVPELNGIVNTEAEEQLHSLIDRFNYCLNTMKPVNHLFMMRLKIHLHNSSMNSTFRAKIEKTFSAQAGHAVETEQDSYGRLLLRREITHLTQQKPRHEPNQASISEEVEQPLSPIIPVSSPNAKYGNSRSSSTSTALGGDHAKPTEPSSSFPSTTPTNKPRTQTLGKPINKLKKAKVRKRKK